MMSPEKDITKLSAEEKQERVRLQKEKISFLSNSQKQQREIWVVAEFLNNSGISFESAELTGGDDPPDVNFRDERFEIKEVDEKNRRRDDECKKNLKKIESATHLQDVMLPYEPKTIEMLEVIDRIDEKLKKFTWDEDFCKTINILFYINYSLIGEYNYVISKDNVWTKWRSVSFVSNNSISCVLFANDNAPQFIKVIKGNVIQRCSL